MTFIRETLDRDGEITRSVLVAKYRISTPQASADFKTFMELNPGAMRYSKTRKRYIAMKPGNGRDTTAAAKSLMAADDAWLQTVARRDPSMIRDVAAALIHERET